MVLGGGSVEIVLRIFLGVWGDSRVGVEMAFEGQSFLGSRLGLGF